MSATKSATRSTTTRFRMKVGFMRIGSHLGALRTTRRSGLLGISIRATRRYLQDGRALFHDGLFPCAIAYPEYPWHAATAFSGAVVLQVHVDMKARISYVEVIRELSPFTRFALNAAKKCQFWAPTLNGKPIFSSTAIAFVFASPPSRF